MWSIEHSMNVYANLFWVAMHDRGHSFLFNVKNVLILLFIQIYAVGVTS